MDASGVLFGNDDSQSLGRYPGQLGEAGTLAAGYPRPLTVHPGLLAEAAHPVRITGNGAGPRHFVKHGWPHSAAGPAWHPAKLTPPHKGMQSNGCAGNFARFLNAR